MPAEAGPQTLGEPICVSGFRRIGLDLWLTAIGFKKTYDGVRLCRVACVARHVDTAGGLPFFGPCTKYAHISFFGFQVMGC